MSANVNGRILGQRYQLLGPVGRGGMASVYRALDSRLDREVAVKVLASDLKDDPSYVSRFVQEAKLSAQLRHPNLVEVFDVGVSDDNELYLVMELLEGRSLAAVIRDEPVALPEFLRIAREITAGVSVLHGANVVHRDLSANNVMLARHGGRSDHVKVLDLGIAKAEGQKTLTEPGSFIGTLESMSPEQIRGEALTATADVYALGVLFYRMLVGAPPFAGEAATLMYHHLEVTPKPVDERSSREVPSALVDLVARCLAKDRRDRPANAMELHEALVQLGALTSRGELGSRASVSGLDAVPDLAPRKTPRAVGRGSAEAIETKRGGLARASLDATPDLAPLELAPIEIAPVEPKRQSLAAPIAESCVACGAPLHGGSVVCASCGQRPPGPVTAFQASGRAIRVVRPLPAWLAPIGFLPVTVGKRVSGYAFLIAVLARLFFRGTGGLALGLVGIGVLAAFGVYVRTRTDEDP